MQGAAIAVILADLEVPVLVTDAPLVMLVVLIRVEMDF